MPAKYHLVSSRSFDSSGAAQLTVNTHLSALMHRPCGLKHVFILITVIGSLLLFTFGSPFHSQAQPEPVPVWHLHRSRNMSDYLSLSSPPLLSPLMSCDGSEFAVVVVTSAPSNYIKRKTIRETWGRWINDPVQTSHLTDHLSNQSHRQSNFAKLNSSLGMKLFFLMGLNEGHSAPTKEMVMEQESFGDLIVENFVDSYLNLTIKSVLMLKFFKNNCHKSNFLLKVDDDVFLSVPNLQTNLLDESLPKQVMVGCLICGAVPIANPMNKYFSPRYMYSEKKYPDYLSGTTYAISGNVVSKVLSTAMATPLFHLEDIFLTGICAKKLGITVKDNIGFSYHSRPPNACLFQSVTMSHEMNGANMRKLWRQLHKDGITSACKPLPQYRIRNYTPTNCQQ